MHHGSHHLARRLRESPSLFDRFMLGVSIAAAFMTLPQILAIWRDGGSGVSLASWLAYALHSSLWLVYGIKHRERTLILANTVWTAMNLVVVGSVLALR